MNVRLDGERIVLLLGSTCGLIVASPSSQVTKDDFSELKRVMHSGSGNENRAKLQGSMIACSNESRVLRTDSVSMPDY